MLFIKGLRSFSFTKVVFCYVPGWEDSERLERGADVTCAIVGAVCIQIRDKH
jgi:hypothetical protein